MTEQKSDDLRMGALYIRVSTHEQDELSPDAQKRLLLDYAKSNGIVVQKDAVFVESVSGRNVKKRKEFQRMIAQAKSPEHPYDVILVWKFSRFARNQEESIVYKSMLKKDRVDVISVSEPVIDGPFGSLIERIIEWMDEYYSLNRRTWPPCPTAAAEWWSRASGRGLRRRAQSRCRCASF